MIEVVNKAASLLAIFGGDDLFNSLFFNGPFNLTENCSNPEAHYTYLPFTPTGFFFLQMLPLLQLNLTDFVFLLQTFEWKAMNHLVDFQWSKNVQEIQAGLMEAKSEA